MKRIIDLMRHPSDEGTLLVGEDKVAVLDCGMAFCAKEKIERVKDLLGGRSVDYLIVGHSHYDHIGSIPHFKKVWPEAKVVAGEHAAAVFQKPGALRTIRNLSVTAAETYRPETAAYAGDYDDESLKADIVVREGDTLPLGGLTLEVLETPGHTKDTLSFFVPELSLLFASESQGVLIAERSMYPCYLVGLEMALRSIDKCAAIPCRHIASPHYGVIDDAFVPDYFRLARFTTEECRDLILDGYKRGLDTQGITRLFADKYRTAALIEKQPLEAFELNTAVTIRTTLKECLGVTLDG